MVETVSFDEFDIDVKQFAQPRWRQQVALGAVGEDSAVAHHHYAVNFREDIGEVMGDEKNAGSLPGEPSQGVAQLPLGGEIERVAGLVEQQDLRLVNEGAAG